MQKTLFNVPKAKPTLPDKPIKQAGAGTNAIACKIKQRRRQMLVHSCLYYDMNVNIVDDFTFDKWAKELVDLQTKYPKESEAVEFYNWFKDWDGSSGYQLPFRTPWVVAKARQLLQYKSNGGEL